MIKNYLPLCILLLMSCTHNPIELIEDVTDIEIKGHYQLVYYDYYAYLGDPIFNGSIVLDSSYMASIDLSKLGYIEVTATKTEMIKCAFKNARNQISQMGLSDDKSYRLFIKESKYQEAKIFKNIIWYGKWSSVGN